jgi:uncharacterized membrane protein
MSTHDTHSSKKSNHGGRKTIDILPDPEILEAYDYIVEGSAQQIMDMFAREQKHRHEWEMKALRTHHLSTVLGQCLGFLICVSIFVSASVIGVFGNQVLAATVWVFGLSIIVMAGLVWMYAKHMGQRPLFGRPQMRTHFRPLKDQHNPVETAEKSAS